MTYLPRETAAGRSRGVLLRTLALATGVLAVEVAGGLWTGSLALLADAAHMLTDVGGLVLVLFASWVATRPPTPQSQAARASSATRVPSGNSAPFARS